MKRCSYCNSVIHDDNARICPACRRPFPQVAPGNSGAYGSSVSYGRSGSYGSNGSYGGNGAYNERPMSGSRYASGNSGMSGRAQQYRGGATHGSRRQAGSVQFSANRFDHTSEYESEEISRDKPIAMMVYLLGFPGMLGGLLCQKSDYLQFHVRQSAKYLIIELIGGFVLLLLNMVVMGTGAAISISNGQISGLGGGALIVAFLTIAFALTFLVLRFICFVQVCRGRVIEAPLVRYFRFMK